MAKYINRENLDFLNDFCIDSGKYAGLRLDEVFDELATTDVAPVIRAKWIEKVKGCYTCSNCLQDLRNNFTYCPCCGAKMDRE